MPVYRKVQKDFFRTWSPEMAYVLGFFAADGSMVKNNRGGHYIEFQIRDKCILQKIRASMGSTHAISEKKQYNKNHKKLYRIQIGSKEICNDLVSLGFTPAKTHSMSWPSVPDAFIGDFVRGYFDGDGNVYFRKHFAKDRQKERWVFSSGFTSGCRDFLESLLMVLRDNGIKGGFICDKERGCELSLSHRDSLALYSLMYNNGDCSLCLDRKKKIFEKAMRTLRFR